MNRYLICYEQTGYGGVDRHTASLIECFLGNEVIVVTNSGNIGVDSLFDQYGIQREDVTLTIIDSANRKSIFRFFHFSLMVSRIIHSEKPDVVIFNNGGFPGSLSCFMVSAICSMGLLTKRMRVLLFLHHAASKSAPVLQMYVAKALCCLVRFTSVVVVAPSNATRRFIIDNTYLHDVQVLYNGLRIRRAVGSGKMLSQIDECRHSIPKLVIGTLSVVDHEKGLHVLLHALRLLEADCLNNFKVEIVGSGDGSYLEVLRNMVCDFGLGHAVSLRGFDPRPAAEILADFDVLISATIDFEGFGYSVVESIICGVPVIATCVGAVPEVVNGFKSVILVAPDDPFALSESIITWFSARDKYLNWAAEDAKVAQQKYGIETMNDSIHKLVGRI